MRVKLYEISLTIVSLGLPCSNNSSNIFGWINKWCTKYSSKKMSIAFPQKKLKKEIIIMEMRLFWEDFTQKNNMWSINDSLLL